MKLFTRWLLGVVGRPGVHVPANEYHLAIANVSEDRGLHVEAAAGVLDRSLVVNLADRYVSARVHPLDIEPKAVQHVCHCGKAVHVLLPSPHGLGEERVVLGGFHSMSSST